MKMVCFQTLTKIKFLFITDPSKTLRDCEIIFKKIYDLYSDMVSKNPFYELDMPIRIDAFETEVTKIFTEG